MSAKAEICFQSVLKGQHVGSQNLTPGSVLEMRREEDNIYDRFAVIALSDERIVGRVPIQFSCLFAKLIDEYHAQITWYVISDFNVCIFQRRELREHLT